MVKKTASLPHILLLPSFYPVAEESLYGIFFQEQAHLLKNAGIQIGVIYPEIRELKAFTPRLFLKNHFQFSHVIEKELPIMRKHGWNLSPGFLRGTMKLWVRSSITLYKKYVAEYGKPDIIYAQSALWAGVAAQAISEKFNLPYVVVEHRDNFLHEHLFDNGIHQKWLTKVLNVAFAKAKQVVAVSTALKKGMARYIQNSEILVIPNFMDTTSFQQKDKVD